MTISVALNDTASANNVAGNYIKRRSHSPLGPTLYLAATKIVIASRLVKVVEFYSVPALLKVVEFYSVPELLLRQ